VFRLDQFMRVCKDNVLLPDGREVTVRTLSETETNGRHDYAVAEAVRISVDVKNPESTLYKNKIAPLLDAPVEAIADLLSRARAQELVREAMDLYPMDFVVAPENATLSEDIETVQRQKSVEDTVYQFRIDHLTNGLKTYREAISKLSKETLSREIELRAQQVYTAAFSEDASMYYTVWCSTEIGNKRVWSTPAEVQNLPPALVTYLYKQYREVDAVDPWEVTKSLSTGDANGVG
jgi:hypothetical protein